MNLKVRLAVMNFLEFAVWGAYLTSMGNYLGKAGMGAEISWFYTIQGIVGDGFDGVIAYFLVILYLRNSGGNGSWIILIYS